MKPQKWNKTEAASSSYSFQEASAVYSRLVITCGTGPAGTEIHLWSCRKTLPQWTWIQAALAGEVPEKCKVGDTTGVNNTITAQIIVSSLATSSVSFSVFFPLDGLSSHFPWALTGGGKSRFHSTTLCDDRGRVTSSVLKVMLRGRKRMMGEKKIIHTAVKFQCMLRKNRTNNLLMQL